MNIVDPRLFKREAEVGEWVDAMIRVRGPAVESLAITFLEDWDAETEAGADGRTLRPRSRFPPRPNRLSARR